ncbi:pirin family protein [Oligoflexus tunisiensis]|uniref:pirin family protein n=1 Tax=Oligoflexus tunisiensis TaxID=708132 RepID=UPI000AD1C919|nr:pirin family protein [Oligoflexus tunisiensis]
MLLPRKSSERGFADHGWLKSWHSFSFAGYFDPRFMGYRQLRVINQDIIAPGQGFPMHSHADMEIITVILRGTIEHQDSMGNKELVKAGEIQRMSAGTGVRHSEFNPSNQEELELLQIWIEPAQRGIEPGYEQATVQTVDGEKLRLLVAPLKEEAPVHIHQNVRIYRGELKKGETLELPLQAERYGWLQMISGTLEARDCTVAAGDGLAIAREPGLPVKAAADDTAFLLFDLA